jgi:large subunit ribosomal protein L20
MTRVKGGTINRARHKKVLKQTEGYFGSKHRLYKTANEQLMHSLKYAYRDRRQKKRDFRKLWITRINAACRENGISYSKFINGLLKAGVTVNRKMLSEIAIDNPKSFAELVNIAKDALVGKDYKPTSVKTDKKIVKEEKTEKEEKVVKETKVSSKKEKVDYSAMTVAELRELAKTKKISGYSTMKKAELIDALK